MATDTSAMTAQEALSTIANLRGYRETLTRRAAGIVWMIWGATLTLLSFQALFVEFPEAMDGPSADIQGSAALEVVGALVALSFAALLTNAVWKAHALQTERTHPAWVPYAAGIGVAFTIGGLNVFSNWLFTKFQTGGHSDGIAFAPLALLATAGALTIAVLQRRRVPMLPGLLASLLLFNVFVFARFLQYSHARDVQFWGASIIAWLPLLVYGVVGVLTFRKA